MILGREAESESAIEFHCRSASLQTLRRTFLNSKEFARQNLLKNLPRTWVVAPVMRGKRLIWIDLGDRFVSRGCLFDSYESAETRFVTTILRAGDVFVDVGANVGWYTLLASTIVGRQGRIHAFEPRAETGDYFEKTVILNRLQKQVTVHRYGLSETEGRALLVWEKGTDNPGHSFVAEQVPSPGMESQSIALRPLDELALQRLDFMKVDVEGAEMRVFRGARATLERCRPVILSELFPEMLERGSGVRTDAFFTFFEQLGYRCFIVDAQRYAEEVTTFPANWHREVLNLGLIPKERSFDGTPISIATSTAQIDKA
jgi:FkbM family methyltransferase